MIGCISLQKPESPKEAEKEQSDDIQYITDTSVLQPIYKRKKDFSSHKQKAKPYSSLQQEFSPPSSSGQSSLPSSAQSSSSHQEIAKQVDSNINEGDLIKPNQRDLSFDSLLHYLDQGDVFVVSFSIYFLKLD